MRTRFAPSPTGYLHLGHVLAAKEAFGFAEKHGGECLLRIEDIDHTRCRPEYIDAIYEDLAWLGFNWPKPARVQSAHMMDYQSALEHLTERGLTYRCFKSRSELTKAPPAPLSHANETIHLSQGKPFAWRLSMAACLDYLKTDALTYSDTQISKTVKISELEDIVIARTDIGTSYHLAVTHDDMLQNITHIVRGADFIEQTPYHVLLQHLMGWRTPAYHHHALLLREDGKKLSKRQKDITIRSLREKGLGIAEVLDMASA